MGLDFFVYITRLSCFPPSFPSFMHQFHALAPSTGQMTVYLYISLFIYSLFMRFIFSKSKLRPQCFLYMSQCTTKSTIRLTPVKTQISLCIAVWSDSLLIACAFYSLRATLRGINENPFHTGWLYRLIWVFAGHRGVFVSFVMCWLIFIWCCCWFVFYKHTYTWARLFKASLA